MVFFSLLPYTTIFDAIQSYGKAHSAIPRPLKLRFSVTSPAQTALFRNVAGTDCGFP